MSNASRGHRVFVLLGSIAVVGVITKAAATRATVHEIPIAYRKEVAGPSLATTPGGAKPRIEVEIVPEAVIVTGNAESIKYHASIVSNVDENGTIAWTAQMVTDTGVVAATVEQGAASIAARGSSTTASFTPNLQDGYYTLRVRGALHTKGWDDAIEAVEYVTVVNGKLREMDFEDWYKLSKASVAVLAPPGFKLAAPLAARGESEGAPGNGVPDARGG